MLPLANPAWLQGTELGCDPQAGLVCRSAPGGPSWAVQWWELAPASPSSTRMQLPCPVGHMAVPEAVPLLQPCLSWVSCKSATLSWSRKTSTFPQFRSTYLKPDSQSAKLPLHCEMKESQGGESRIWPWFPLWSEDPHDPAGSRTGTPALSGTYPEGVLCFQAVTLPLEQPCAQSCVARSFLPTPTPCQVPPLPPGAAFSSAAHPAFLFSFLESCHFICHLWFLFSTH